MPSFGIYQHELLLSPLLLDMVDVGDDGVMMLSDLVDILRYDVVVPSLFDVLA